MSPKQCQFTPEDITAAALQILIERGGPALTVRNIAAGLGCSTAPLYTVMGSFEAIKAAAMDKAMQVFFNHFERHYTPDVFMNVGVGYLVFARDYPLLYKEIFLSDNQYGNLIDRLNIHARTFLKHAPISDYLSDALLSRAYEKITVFCHGLASLICNGLVEQSSDQYFIDTMAELGTDFFIAEAFKSNRSEALQALLPPQKDHSELHSQFTVHYKKNYYEEEK